ncbi:MAG: NAD(P)H-binding protein [Planctomycetes bacterium]|nr:NAD(P)H-binding protein [Planctomycetota bacterium]
MKVAVIGHTGMGGITLVDLLLARGHQVTGVALDADKHPTKEGLTSITCSVMDTDALAQAIDGHDVVVSAFSGGHRVEMGVYYRQVEGTRRMIKAFKEVKGKYFVYIGGAASLYVKPGLQLFDDPRFPRWYFGVAPANHLRWLADVTREDFFVAAAERKENGTIKPGESDKELEDNVASWTSVPLLEGCRVALDLFEADHSFKWSFLSPPWFYRPGDGTGHYDLGVDFMMLKNGIPAGISVPDLQLAVADEVDAHKLVHKYWTVAGDN